MGVGRGKKFNLGFYYFFRKSTRHKNFFLRYCLSVRSLARRVHEHALLPSFLPEREREREREKESHDVFFIHSSKFTARAKREREREKIVLTTHKKKRGQNQNLWETDRQDKT